MDDDFKALLLIIGSVLFVLTVIAISVSITSIKNNKTFAENGYEQVILPGSSSFAWQKAD